MADTQGHVRIAVSFDTKAADGSVRKITQAFARLGENARRAVHGVTLGNVEREARSTSEAIRSVRDEMKNMTGAEAKTAAQLAKQLAAIDQLIARIASADAKAETTVTSLIGKQQTLEASLRKAQAAAEALQEKWNTVNASLKRDKATGEVLPGQDKEIAQLDKLGYKMADLDDKAARYRARLDEIKTKIEQVSKTRLDTDGSLRAKLEAAQASADALKRKLDEIQQTEVMPSGTSVKGNIADALQRSFGRLKSTAGNVFSSIRGYASRSLRRIDKLLEPLHRGFRRLAEQFRQVFVFSVIIAGLNAVKRLLGNIVEQDSKISGQLATIKGNLYSAFQPLWTAIYPFVIKILNGFIAITSAIANLSRQLFGAASSGANALYEEADAIGAVGEAAAGASKELGTFDEINQLDGGTGGGAGGSGVGTGNGLVTDLSWTIQDIYDRLMAIQWDMVAAKINRALLNIDFVMIGTNLRNGVLYITNTLSELLTGIDWEQLGENIADGLNVLLTGDMLPNIAKTLSDWFNAKIRLFYGFVSTFDWEGFGDSVADSINTFFSNTDWETFGLAVDSFGQGVLDALLTVLEETNWEDIGEDIAIFIRNINWGEWTKKIGRIIWAALKGLGKIAISITDVLFSDGGVESTRVASDFETALTGILGLAGLVAAGPVGGLFGLSIGAGIKMLIDSVTAEGGTAIEKAINIGDSLVLILGGILGFASGITMAGNLLLISVGAILGITLADIVWGDVKEYDEELLAGASEKLENLNETLNESAKSIMANALSNASSGVILKSLAGEEDFAAHMQTFGVSLDELNSRADHTIQSYVQLRTELRAAYEAFKETGNIDQYKQTLKGLGLDAETVELILGKLVTSTGAISTNTGSAATAMNDVESSMKATAKQGAKLESSMEGVATETENADDALSDEYETLGKIEDEFDTSATANETLATSTEDLATTTNDGIVTMDTALKNNLAGWGDYAMQLSAILDNATNRQSAFWSRMASAASTAAESVKRSFSSVASYVERAFAGAWTNVLEAMGGNSFTDITKGVNTMLRSGLNSMINGLNSVLRNTLNQMNSVLNQLRGTRVMGMTPFAGIRTISIPTIPKLAKGAVIPANNEFLAILGDQKHGTNVEAPLDTIVEAMLFALRESSAGGSSPEAIAAAVRAALAGMAVQFDSEKVGRVVAAQIDHNRRADGKFAYDLA